MTGTSNRGPNAENNDFRALTLTNLLIMIAFLMPILTVFAELKHAGGGLLRYSIGLLLSTTSAVLIVVAEWQLLRLISTQFERYSSRWSSARAVALWLLLVTTCVVAGATVGDLIVACLIQWI